MNRKYKDGIFRYLFRDPQNFVDLYKLISGKTITADELIFKDTSSLVVNKDYYNDISYLTNDNRLIIAVEHQSTINENMALRTLIYYTELLSIYIKENNLNIFKEKAVKIPKGEFYVVYNGEKPLKNKILDLKENFLDGSSDINLKVKIVNINYDKLKNKEDKNTVTGYSYYVNAIRKYSKYESDMNKVLQLAKEDCLRNKYLSDYLNRKEFLSMVMEEYTFADELMTYKNDGIEQGIEQGIEKTNLKVIRASLEKNLDIKLISDITGLTTEEIEKLKKDL